MKRNIIDAIYDLVSNPQLTLKEYASQHNRANDMGESLEQYIKDLFAGTTGVMNAELRAKKLSETFAYLGNKNNPPDAIIRGDLAIEIKKIESNDNSIALNSSHPKDKLYSSSTMISKACRGCEVWTEKDMLYCIGVVKNSHLKSLALVYGEDYCANEETYKIIKNRIKTGVESIQGVEFTSTRELGRVNRVDPLGITHLRVRGMWSIENPFKVFGDHYQRDTSCAFNLMVIINDNQLSKLTNIQRLYDLQKDFTNLQIKSILIKNPNNPAQLKSATLITYKI